MIIVEVRYRLSWAVVRVKEQQSNAVPKKAGRSNVQSVMLQALIHANWNETFFNVLS